jgi:hypothetical protein
MFKCRSLTVLRFSTNEYGRTLYRQIIWVCPLEDLGYEFGITFIHHLATFG